MLVGIHQKEVERIIAVVLEQIDIHIVHAGNTHAHVLRHEFAAWRIDR